MPLLTKNVSNGEVTAPAAKQEKIVGRKMLILYLKSLQIWGYLHLFAQQKCISIFHINFNKLNFHVFKIKMQLDNLNLSFLNKMQKL